VPTDCIPNADKSACLACGWKKPERIKGWPRRNCGTQPDLEPAAKRLGLTLADVGPSTSRMLAQYAAGQPLGPGDWLHVRLLQLIGESPSHSCGCENRIAQMNTWGAVECREHLSEIVDWLREQANNKGWWKYLNKLPGARWAVEKIVLWAIVKSEKESYNANGQEAGTSRPF